MSARKNLVMVGRLHHLSKARGHAAGPTSCSSGSTSPTRRPAGQDVLGRHAPAARPRRQPGRRARRCCSSTSRPPGSTRAAATTCGTCSASLVRDGTTVILTTQYLEEADQLADDIVVLDHGRTVAHGTPDELKAQIGTDRIDVTVATTGRARRGRRARLQQFASNAAEPRPRAARRDDPGRRGHPAHGRDARARRRRHRRRRPQPPPGDARRRVPHPHRVRPVRHSRGGVRHDRDRRTHPAATPIAPPARRDATERTARSRTWWSDTLVFAGRNIEHIRQIPEKLLDVTLQPLMFVLLFAYVFGGAIAVDGGSYREYLIGGILIQSLAFGLDRSGHRDLDRPHRRRDRPLPLAARDAHRLPLRPLPRRARRHGAVDRRAARRRAHRRLGRAHRSAPRHRLRSCCCSCSAPR